MGRLPGGPFPRDSRGFRGRGNPLEKPGFRPSTPYDLMTSHQKEGSVYSLNSSNHRPYHTTGQVAKSLRVSVSTLKRWLEENPSLAGFRTNASGWRLFSPDRSEERRVGSEAEERGWGCGARGD